MNEKETERAGPRVLGAVHDEAGNLDRLRACVQQPEESIVL